MKRSLGLLRHVTGKAPKRVRVILASEPIVYSPETGTRAKNLVCGFCVCAVLGPEVEHFPGRRGRQLVVVALELDQLVVRSCSSKNLVLQQSPQGGPGYV